jgi:hypothetical protein
MLVRQNQSFNFPGHSGSIHPRLFDRHLAANLLVSVYGSVLQEPLPERLEALLRELESRERLDADNDR